MTVRAEGRSGPTFALCTALLWSMLPVSVGPVLARSDAITITWFRFCVSGLLLLVILRAKGMLHLNRAADRRLLWLLPVTVVSLVVNYVLYISSLHFVSPAVSATVIQLAPVLMMLGGMYVFGERFVPMQWLGFVLLLIGIAVFCQQRVAAAGVDRHQLLLGVGVLVAAAICWAVYGLAQKSLLRYAHSQTTMVAIYLAGGLLLLPQSNPSTLLELRGMEVYLLLFMALNTLVAYGCFAEALNQWEAAKVSAVLATVPLMTLFLSWLLGLISPQQFVPERISGLMIAGAALVTAGSCLCAAPPPWRRQSRAERQCLPGSR